MKNKLNTFVITLASLGLLAACNRNTPAPAPQPGPDEGEGEGEGGETLTALEQEVKGFLEHRGVTGVMVPFIKDVEAEKVQDKEVHPDSYTPEGETDEYAPVFKFNVTDPAAYTGYLATLEANNWTVGEYGDNGYECVDPAQKVEVDVDYFTQENIDAYATAGYDVSELYPCTIVNIYAYADLYGEPEDPFVPGEPGYVSAAFESLAAAAGFEDYEAPDFLAFEEFVKDMEVLLEPDEVTGQYRHVGVYFEGDHEDDILDLFEAEDYDVPEVAGSYGFEITDADKNFEFDVKYQNSGYTTVYMYIYVDLYGEPVDLGGKTLPEHVAEFLAGRGVEDVTVPGLAGYTEENLKEFEVVAETEEGELAELSFTALADFVTPFATEVEGWDVFSEPYTIFGIEVGTKAIFRDPTQKVLVMAIAFDEEWAPHLIEGVSGAASAVVIYAYADYFAVNGDPFPATEFPAEDIVKALAELGIEGGLPAFTGEAKGYSVYAEDGFQLTIMVEAGNEETARDAYGDDLVAAGFIFEETDEDGDLHYVSADGKYTVYVWQWADNYPGYVVVEVEAVEAEDPEPEVEPGE